jgi:hypothetical protein
MFSIDGCLELMVEFARFQYIAPQLTVNILSVYPNHMCLTQFQQSLEEQWGGENAEKNFESLNSLVYIDSIPDSLRDSATDKASSQLGKPFLPPYSRQEREAVATENFTD